jgi:hypothetical protein
MTNFDAGFDRKKKNFIDKANKGNGFTPIDYSFIKNFNAQILKVNYIKAGSIDNYYINSYEIHVNYLEANEIYAGTIRAGKIIVSEVDVTNLYADHIYSNNIDNKQTINTSTLNSTTIFNKAMITTLELNSLSQYGANAVFERLNFGVTVPIFGNPILPGFFNGFGTVDLIASITIRPDPILWPTNNFTCKITNSTSFESGVFNLASKAGINMQDDSQVIISVGDFNDVGEMTISSKNKADFTARNEINITTTNNDVNLSKIVLKTDGNLSLGANNISFTTNTNNTSITVNDNTGITLLAKNGTLNSDILLESKSSAIIKNQFSTFRLNTNGSSSINSKSDVSIYSASGTIELEAPNGINITSNLTATNNVKGNKSITFGGITFESQVGSVSTYYWPAPPLLPAITSFYFLSTSKASVGSLSWESQLLETEVLIPYSITYASPILGTGEVEFVTQFIPESLPAPDIQEIIVGPFFSTDEFGVISILTRTVTILPLPVAKRTLAQKITNERKIIIDGIEYTIPTII